MIAVLVTDASYCVFTRTGAWAAWIESGRGRLLVGNVIPGSIGGANSAEMWAAARGLEAGVERGIVGHGDHVQFQTDSTFVAFRLRSGYQSRRAKARIKRGDPPAPAELTEISGPRQRFLHFVAANSLTIDVERSGHGDRIRAVDRFARRRMLEERAVRQGRMWSEASSEFEVSLEAALRARFGESDV